MEKESASLNTKTQRRLRNAYCRLINENGIDKVNVSNLTQEADVSRATFYIYYKDIEDFKKNTYEYILGEFIKQICIFLESTRSEVKEKCKRKNLTFTADNFELFHSLFINNQGFNFNMEKYKSIFMAFYGNAEKHFSDKFIKKNKNRFDLFYSGYVRVMRDNFLDYHSDKAARDVLRTMDVWDYLFPDYKYKD